jgi:hypothetical protein
MQRSSFLPVGTFEQLTATALSWSQLTPRSTPCDLTLKKDLLILFFGNVWFRMVHRPHHSCIQVDVASPTVLPVLYRLLKMLVKMNISSEMLAEKSSTEYLHVMPYIALPNTPTDQMVFLSVKRLTAISTARGFPITLPCRMNVDSSMVQAQFPWLSPRHEMVELTQYEMFISYRWNPDFEDEFVACLRDRLGDFNLEGRAMRIFRDNECIEVGVQIQDAFFGSLMNSVLMVPVVSHAALNKMLDTNAERDVSVADNLLAEWLSALIFLRLRSQKFVNGQNEPSDLVEFTEKIKLCVRLEKVYPVFVTNGVSLGAFKEANPISDEKPAATVELVMGLLNRHIGRIPPGVVEWIEAYTIKSIVDGIMLYNCPRQASISCIDMKRKLSISTEEILKVFLPDNIYGRTSRVCEECPFV